MKVALTGPACAGKTTLANYLRDICGFYKMNFTDLIKEEAAELLGHTVEDIKKNKEYYRPFLIELAKHRGYDNGFGVTRLIYAWQDAGCPEHVVFDNVRFPKQYELLMPHGFTLVYLDVSKEVLQQHAAKKGTSVYELDRAHANMPNLSYDVMVNANKPVEQIAETLLRLADIKIELTVPEFEMYSSGKDQVLYRI